MDISNLKQNVYNNNKLHFLLYKNYNENKWNIIRHPFIFINHKGSFLQTNWFQEKINELNEFKVVVYNTSEILDSNQHYPLELQARVLSYFIQEQINLNIDNQDNDKRFTIFNFSLLKSDILQFIEKHEFYNIYKDMKIFEKNYDIYDNFHELSFKIYQEMKNKDNIYLTLPTFEYI